MKQKGLLVLFLLLTVLIIPYDSTLAKGQPERLVINGPDLMTEIVVDDPNLLEALAMTRLEDIKNPITPQEIIGPIYVLTRYFKDGKSFIPFDQVLYVPDSEGEPGAIYVVGINNGSSPYDGRWYGVHQDSEAVLLSVLAEQGAPRLDQYSKQPEVNITPTLKTIMGISVIGLIILVGWVTKRN